MTLSLPDSEARRFLKMGDAKNVAEALSVHVSYGLEVLSLDKDACIIRLDQTEVAFPTAQQLKKTVALANSLFGVAA